jgi:hypothetical protein
VTAPLKSTTIKSSSAKAWFFLVVSTLILLMGLFLLAAPGKLLSAWFGITFGGLCVAIFVRMLARPLILILDKDGFAIDGGYGALKKTAWRDVEEFVVHELPRGGKVVA